MPEHDASRTTRDIAREVAESRVRRARSLFAASLHALRDALAALPEDSDQLDATNRSRAREALETVGAELSRSAEDAEAFEIILQGLADE